MKKYKIVVELETKDNPAPWVLQSIIEQLEDAARERVLTFMCDELEESK